MEARFKESSGRSHFYIRRVTSFEFAARFLPGSLDRLRFHLNNSHPDNRKAVYNFPQKRKVPEHYGSAEHLQG